MGYSSSSWVERGSQLASQLLGHKLDAAAASYPSVGWLASLLEQLSPTYGPVVTQSSSLSPPLRCGIVCAAPETVQSSNSNICQ